MSDVKGYAAFHLAHNKHGSSGTRSDRSNLLSESMRHLDEKDTHRFAAENPSIVISDTHLNEGFVNNGNGGFDVVTDISQVLDYGDSRVANVKRKIQANQDTLNRFVIHLPRTLCREVPDFYPRFHEDGSPMLDPTGEQMKRSRLVARDRDEAMRYFSDVIEILGDDVIPGGVDAIHGWATNFDETTPHIQLMADPFAPDPSDPDKLRTDQTRAYGTHRDIKDDKGKQVRGERKLSQYQEVLRTKLIDKGWPVEMVVSERAGKTLGKSEYEEMRDSEARAEVYLATADETAGVLVEWEKDLKSRAEDLDRQEREVAAERDALPRLRKQAKKDGFADASRAAHEELAKQFENAAQRRRENEEVRRQLTELGRTLAAKQRDVEEKLEQLDAELERLRKMSPHFEAYLQNIGREDGFKSFVSDREKSRTRARAMMGKSPNPPRPQPGRGLEL